MSFTVGLLKVRASDFEYKAFEDLNFEEMAKGTNNLTSIIGSILSEVLYEARVFLCDITCDKTYVP